MLLAPHCEVRGARHGMIVRPPPPLPRGSCTPMQRLVESPRPCAGVCNAGHAGIPAFRRTPEHRCSAAAGSAFPASHTPATWSAPKGGPKHRAFGHARSAIRNTAKRRHSAEPSNAGFRRRRASVPSIAHPWPCVRVGHDWHGLCACECIEPTFPFHGPHVHLPQCAPGRARSAAGVQRRTSAANARRMPSQRDSMADPQLMRTSVAAHHRARPATAGTRRGSLARRPARARSSTAARSRGHGARPPVLPSANETSRKCRRLLCAC